MLFVLDDEHTLNVLDGPKCVANRFEVQDLDGYLVFDETAAPYAVPPEQPPKGHWLRRLFSLPSLQEDFVVPDGDPDPKAMLAMLEFAERAAGKPSHGGRTSVTESLEDPGRFSSS